MYIIDKYFAYTFGSKSCILLWKILFYLNENLAKVIYISCLSDIISTIFRSASAHGPQHEIIIAIASTFCTSSLNSANEAQAEDLA